MTDAERLKRIDELRAELDHLIAGVDPPKSK